MGIINGIRRFLFFSFVLSFLFLSSQPVFADGPGAFRFRELSGSFDVILSGKGDDRIISLPISYGQVRRVEGVGMDIDAKAFEYGGRHYLLVKANYDVVPDVSALVTPGELFLVRDDGQYFRFAHSSVGLNISFDGPLLVVTGVPRKVNLDQFDAERASPDEWPFRHRFSFVNGASLVFEESQLAVDGKDRIFMELGGVRRQVFEGRVQGIPDRELESDFLNPGTKSLFYGVKPALSGVDTYKNLAFVVADGKWRIILDDGRMLTPPVDYNYVAAKTAGGHPDFSVAPLTYNGSNFFLVKFVYQKNSGEIYLVRGDGKFVRMGYVSEGTKHQINDGILTVTQCVRPIDLQRFDAEARFQSGYPSSLNDGDGTRDPYDVVSNFTRVASRDSEILELPFEDSGPEDILAIRRTLAKRNTRSIVLLGPGGSGKSTKIRIFLRQMFEGAFPEIPRTTFALILDAAALEAGTKNVGTYALKVKALLDVLASCGPSLLVIENMHTLRGQGTHSESSIDFFAMVAAAVSSGKLAILADDTADAFQHYFVGNQALYGAFTQRNIAPLGRDKIFQALRAQAARFTPTPPSEEVLNRIIDLSTNFNALSAQPRSAIQLLEEVYADLSIGGRPDLAPTLHDVEQSAKRLYQVDEAFFDSEKRAEKLRGLPEKLDAVIVGQKSAKKMTAEAVEMAYFGVSDASKPQVRMVYPGEKGQGKTELARGFADAMGLPFVRIEMNHADSAEDVLRNVANALRINAFTVILFDEPEKARLDVQNAVLAALDSGTFTVAEKLTSSSGSAPTFVRVNARSASFFWATNAGERYLRGGNVMGFGAEQEGGGGQKGSLDERKLREAMIQDNFSSYVLDRTQVAAFVALSRAEMKEVVRLHLIRFQNDQLSRERRTIQFVDMEGLLESLLREHLVPGISPRQLLENALPFVKRQVAASVSMASTRRGCPQVIQVVGQGASHPSVSMQK